MAGPIAVDLPRRKSVETDLRRCLVISCRLKPPHPAPPPQKHLAITIFALQSGGDLEERAIDHGAIVIGEDHQASLGDQPAELDQLAGAFAALHDPGSPVMARQ